MKRANNERGESTATEHALRDPIAAEVASLTATEESTGQRTLEGAHAVARGDEPPGNPDEAIVNGYRGGEDQADPIVEQVREVTVPPRPRIDY